MRVLFISMSFICCYIPLEMGTANDYNTFMFSNAPYVLKLEFLDAEPADRHVTGPVRAILEPQRW